jgi:hypothetical protein
VPGIEDEFIAAKATGMLSNDVTIGNYAQAIRSDSDRNELTYPNSGDTVMISSNPGNTVIDDGNIKNHDVSSQLGFNILAIAVHDLHDLKLKKLSFVAESINGLKTVSFKNIESYGFEVFTHGLCHVTLKDVKGHLLNS